MRSLAASSTSLREYIRSDCRSSHGDCPRRDFAGGERSVLDLDNEPGLHEAPSDHLGLLGRARDAVCVRDAIVHAQRERARAEREEAEALRL